MFQVVIRKSRNSNRLSWIGSRWTRLASAVLLITLCYKSHAADMKPEDLVAHHLDSISTSQARAAVKSRAVQGTLRFKVLVGGGGEVIGSWGRVSEQRQSNFVMRFGSGDWLGEQFKYDGQKTYVAGATSSHRKSVFGQLMSSQDFIIQEGLLGGELSTAWALQNLDQNRPKLTAIGLKKIDGRELLGIQYYSRGSSDVEVKIYFDPETYRHVMTVYSILLSANLGGTVTNSSRQRDIRYTIEERFSDFKTVGGITLPRHYDLQYTQELQNGTTRVFDWDMTADQVTDNISLDPANFQFK
jgi:hypothetical protein